MFLEELIALRYPKKMENKKIDTGSGKLGIFFFCFLGLVILYFCAKTGKFDGLVLIFPLSGWVLASDYFLKRRLSRLTTLLPQHMEMRINQEFWALPGPRRLEGGSFYRIELFSPPRTEKPHSFVLVNTRVAHREFQRILSKTEKVLVYGLENKSGPVLIKTTSNEWLWSKGTERR